MRRIILLVHMICLAAPAGVPPRAEGDDDLTAAQRARVTPVVEAYRLAKPAVVNISAQQLVSRSVFSGGDPFDDIFPDLAPRRRSVQSLGSGVLVHRDGYIVTNAHVIRRAQKVVVSLADGSEFEAGIISSDPRRDLAVLKIDPPENSQLPYLPLGRSDDLMVGETVIAIGNPLGYANSLTTGVISATDRELNFRGGVSIEGLIQTDAPINPGNSGGPLLNINGELIGINTAIRGDAQNIGFAIPVDSLARTLVELLDFERINRVIFGADVVQRQGPDGHELYVDRVRPDTPAARELAAGDRLLAIDGQSVSQITEYTCRLLQAKPDERLSFTIQRGHQRRAVQVTLQAKPRPDGRALAQGLLGVKLLEIDKNLARRLRLPVDSGVVIAEIQGGSPADAVGLQPRDVIFQLGQYYVKNIDDVGMLLEGVESGSALRIGILRGNVAAWTTVRTSSER